MNDQTTHIPNTPNEPAIPVVKTDRWGWMRTSITLRVILIGILVLLLLIPLGMVGSLIQEREERKNEAVNEVSNTWGGAQTITGPIISVPYSTTTRVDIGDGKTELREVTEFAHFLPEKLNVDGDLSPEKRHRGIYDVVVYKSHLLLSGTFKPMVNNTLGMNDKLRWSEAFVTIGISDLRSIKEQVAMQLGGRPLAFEPGAPTNDVIGTGLSAAFACDTACIREALPFSIELQLNGSSSLRIAPVGKVTRASMKSNWPDPSFSGAFLPDSSSITTTNFAATWTVLHLNRPYPQEFLGARSSEVQESAFGTDLIVPVDEYQKNTRAAKYGVMLIVLVFLVFFFVEVLQKMRIHPIQYLLVGLALCIFYTLLIALSEHIGFAKAYVISAFAVLSLVVYYASSVFKMMSATRLLGMVMLLVFGFMFTLINQEDYALLIGSIGLFVVLAIVMALSRRIDWSGGRAS